MDEKTQQLLTTIEFQIKKLHELSIQFVEVNRWRKNKEAQSFSKVLSKADANKFIDFLLFCQNTMRKIGMGYSELYKDIKITDPSAREYGPAVIKFNKKSIELQNILRNPYRLDGLNKHTDKLSKELETLIEYICRESVIVKKVFEAKIGHEKNPNLDGSLLESQRQSSKFKSIEERTSENVANQMQQNTAQSVNKMKADLVHMMQSKNHSIGMSNQLKALMEEERGMSL